jgi:hypothetical protein
LVEHARVWEALLEGAQALLEALDPLRRSWSPYEGLGTLLEGAQALLEGAQALLEALDPLKRSWSPSGGPLRL